RKKGNESRSGRESHIEPGRVQSPREGGRTGDRREGDCLGDEKDLLSVGAANDRGGAGKGRALRHDIEGKAPGSGAGRRRKTESQQEAGPRAAELRNEAAKLVAQPLDVPAAECRKLPGPVVEHVLQNEQRRQRLRREPFLGQSQPGALT